MTDTHTSIQRYLIVYGFIMIWVKAANSTEYFCITHTVELSIESYTMFRSHMTCCMLFRGPTYQRQFRHLLR